MCGVGANTGDDELPGLLELGSGDAARVHGGPRLPLGVGGTFRRPAVSAPLAKPHWTDNIRLLGRTIQLPGQLTTTAIRNGGQQRGTETPEGEQVLPGRGRLCPQEGM